MHEDRFPSPDRPAAGSRPAAAPAPPAEAPGSLPRRVLSPLAVTLLIAFFVLLAAGGYKTWRDLVTVERRAQELRQDIARTRDEIRTLESQLDRLQNDPNTLERLAREELAMVKPEDLVIVLPEEQAPSKTP